MIWWVISTLWGIGGLVGVKSDGSISIYSASDGTKLNGVITYTT